MKIIFDISNISSASIVQIYEKSGCGIIDTQHLTTKMFSDSIFAVGVLNNTEEIVGLARIFSDDEICSWIAEICIEPTDEKEKIYRLLLNAIITRFGHTAIFSEAFEAEIDFLHEVGITKKQRLTAVSRAPTLEAPKKPEPFLH